MKDKVIEKLKLLKRQFIEVADEIKILSNIVKRNLFY